MKIIKDSIERDVTRGAFESIYKKNGWAMKNSPSKKENINDEIDTLSEIPLSEMSAAQLVEYAEELGVQVEEGTTKKQLREKIRAALS